MSVPLQAVDEVLDETVPGKDNDVFVESLGVVSMAVDSFIETTHNWYEIKKLHVYEDRIGITAKYRWTIERWVSSNAQKDLESHGWDKIAHTDADWRGREDHELEIRYVNEFYDVPVKANLLVEMTESAFQAVNENKRIETNARLKNKRVSQFLEDSR